MPWGFPESSAGKESVCNAGDSRLIPVSGISTGEGIGYPFHNFGVSIVAQVAKNPPAMWETWIQSRGWDNPLEKGKVTPVFWPREFHGLYRSWGCKELDTTDQLSLSLSTWKSNA